MTGFSLIEFLLVTTLFSVVALIMFPMGMSFYNSQVLNETVFGIETTLRNAYINAVTQKHDTDHGVKILSDNYILFAGDSFENRDISLDFVVPFTNTIELSGLTEVIFQRFTGTPNSTGTLTLNLNEQETEIVIYQNGFIE